MKKNQALIRKLKTLSEASAVDRHGRLGWPVSMVLSATNLIA